MSIAALPMRGGPAVGEAPAEVRGPGAPGGGVGGPDGVVGPDLALRAGVLSGRIARLHAELVDLTAELLAELEDHVTPGGYRSPEHWLAVHTGFPTALCRHLVRLAERREELPVTMERLAAGAITAEQAGAIAQHVPAWAEERASIIASGTSATQFARFVTRHRFEREPAEYEEQVPAPATKPSDLSIGQRGDRFTLRYETDPVTGALVAQAIREAKDALVTSGQAGATLADALGEVASRSLAGIESVARREHYRVMIHLDTSGAGWVERQGALPPELLRRVTCDGQVRPVWETEGHPVSVGRSQRIVPDRTRRLVEDRDQGCRYPGCGARGFLENHHIDHWADGGATDIDTLVSLCSFHHDDHHRGSFTITGHPGSPDGLVFRTGHGFVIARHHDPGDGGGGDADGNPSNAGPGWFPDGWEPDRSFPRGEPLLAKWVDLGRPPNPETSSDGEPTWDTGWLSGAEPASSTDPPREAEKPVDGEVPNGAGPDTG